MFMNLRFWKLNHHLFCEPSGLYTASMRRLRGSCRTCSREFLAESLPGLFAGPEKKPCRQKPPAPGRANVLDMEICTTFFLASVAVLLSFAKCRRSSEMYTVR